MQPFSLRTVYDPKFGPELIIRTSVEGHTMRANADADTKGTKYVRCVHRTGAELGRFEPSDLIRSAVAQDYLDCMMSWGNTWQDHVKAYHQPQSSSAADANAAAPARNPKTRERATDSAGTVRDPSSRERAADRENTIDVEILAEQTAANPAPLRSLPSGRQ